MANVLRRYSSTPGIAGFLTRELAPGGFVSVTWACPLQVIDVTVDDGITNVREDLDTAMLELGYAFVAEDPTDTIYRTANILLQPVLDAI
jgi:hypothetical protein